MVSGNLERYMARKIASSDTQRGKKAKRKKETAVWPYENGIRQGRRDSRPGDKGGKVRSGKKTIPGRGPTPKAEDRHWAKKRREKERVSRDTAKPLSVSVTGSPRSLIFRGGRAREKRDVLSCEDRESTSQQSFIFGKNCVLQIVQNMQADVHFVGLCGSAASEYELLLNKREIDTAKSKILQITSACREKGIEICTFTKEKMREMAGGSLHQGVCASVGEYRYKTLKHVLQNTDLAQNPIFVVLDKVTDPRNFGAVVRSCAAFGVQCVIVPKRRSAQVTQSAWSASAGALATVSVVQVPNIPECIKEFKRAGIFCMSLDANAQVSVRNTALRGVPLAIIAGSEGDGVSRLVQELCDESASIPLENGIDSLNVSVACSLALYELRQKVYDF